MLAANVVIWLVIVIPIPCMKAIQGRHSNGSEALVIVYRICTRFSAVEMLSAGLDSQHTMGALRL